MRGSGYVLVRVAIVYGLNRKRQSDLVRQFRGTKRAERKGLKW